VPENELWELAKFLGNCLQDFLAVSTLSNEEQAWLLSLIAQSLLCGESQEGNCLSLKFG
jgi:hypothetical protein